MVRDRAPHGYTTCVICDDVTASAKVPPVCHDCLYLMARGNIRPGAVSPSVADALAALMTYRGRLGLAGPPTTDERLRWCLDYCRARGDYLRACNGTPRPVVPVPHTDPGTLSDMRTARPPPIHSRGNYRALGP